MTAGDIRRLTLGNGVRVTLAPAPALPVATVYVRAEVGSRHERPGRTGLAHLFEHLMFAATRNLPSGEHARVIETAGGYTNATTTSESTAYFDTVPPGAVCLALWLQGSRLTDLPAAIDQEVLQVQRGVVRSERRQAVDNTPYGEAPELLAAAMFPAPHPFHHTATGSIADIEAASLADACQFFREHYLPGRILVCVAGQFSVGAVTDAVERYFGGLAPGTGTPAVAPWRPPTEHIRLDRVSAAPPSLIISHYLPPAGTRECTAAELTACLLAGGQASRLDRRLRQESAHAVNVSFTVQPMITGGSTAVARLRPRNNGELTTLETAYLAELTSLAETGPADDEFARARAQWLARWLTATDTAQGRAAELTWQWLAAGVPPEPGQARDQIESVTPEEIRRCAAALTETRRVTLSFRSG